MTPPPPARPFPPPTGWRPTTRQVPADQVQFFNAPCPTCGGLAEWVASRVDSRSRSEVWCPVCGVGLGGIGRSAASGGGSDGLGGRTGSHGQPGGDLASQSVSREDAA